MKNIWNVMVYSFRESLTRKVFWTFGIISTLAIILAFGILLYVNPGKNILTDPDFVKMPLDQILSNIQLGVLNPLLSLGLLLSIFAASNFIPTMLDKGTVDIFLSKPIARYQLLIGRILGTVGVVFINMVYLIFGIWLAFAISFNIYSFTFLYLILTSLLTFVALYSIMVFFGVVFKSSIGGMMTSYLIFLIVSPLLAYREVFYKEAHINSFWKTIVDTIYYIIPKTAELFGIISANLMTSKPIESYQPIYTTLAFIFFVIGGSIIIFEKKDF